MHKDDDFPKNHIKYFSLTTSVKGVARITRSDKKCLRVMWLVAVLVFLAVSISQVFYLLGEYLEYHSTTNLKEGVLSIETSHKIVIPEVTICSLTPLSSSAQRIADQYSIPKAFERRIKELRKCSECTEEEQKTINKTLDRNEIPEGYYQFIGREAAEKLSHLQETIIADCKIIVFQGFDYVYKPCKNAIIFVPWFSPKYYNCFVAVLKYDELSSGTIASGVSLSLYADHHKPMDTSGAISMKQAGGFVISVDKKNQVPFSGSTSIILDTNEFTHVEISQVIIHRLTRPYSDCVASATIGKVNDINTTAEYTQRACIAVCIENQIIDKCQCQETQLINILEDMDPEKVKNIPFCEDLKLPVNILIRNSRCLDTYRVTVRRECEEICPKLCTEILFKLFPSSSRWPVRDAMAQFYEQFIKDKPYQDKFPSQESANEVKLFNIVKRQFLKFSVYHGSPTIKQYNNTATIPLSNLLSRLGGALNLWSGITVIVLMEIIDVLYRVVWFAIRHRK